jgi:hypothetical protein
LEIVEPPLTGHQGEVSERYEYPGKEPMIMAILITGTKGMIVGFGGTLMSLFGDGTPPTEYLEFVVMPV